MNKNYQDKFSTEIILIAEFFDPKINSTGLYWYSIAKELAKKTKVTILSPHIDKSLESIGCNIKEVKSKNSFFSKILPVKLLIFLNIFSASKTLEFRNSKVLIGTNPYLLPLIISYIKIKKPKTLNLLCYDLFPENISLQSNFFIRTIFRILSFAFSYAYKSCDKVIAVGRDMKSKLIELNYGDSDSIIYIPNWAEKSKMFQIQESNNDKKKIKILFFGNFGRFQAIPEILNQISNVTNDNVEFLFAGSGEKEKLIIKAALNDSRIIFLGKISMEEKDNIYARTDLSIVSIKNGMRGLCVPSKAYFSLINSHPIICFVEKNSELDYLCKDYNCGWVADLINKNALNNLIEKFSWDEFNIKFKNTESIPKSLLNGEDSLKKITELMI